MTRRRCDYCGDPFDARSQNSRFCSRICATLSRARIAIEDICENCHHARAAHFAGRGSCSLFVNGTACSCAHFKYTRLP